jgi:hypothetical protein
MESKLILKREGETCSLFNGEVKIENYSFSQNIDFSKLLDFLMKDGFETRFDLDYSLISDPSDEEQNLEKVLNQIVHSYLERVDEFLKFKRETDGNTNLND